MPLPVAQVELGHATQHQLEFERVKHGEQVGRNHVVDAAEQGRQLVLDAVAQQVAQPVARGAAGVVSEDQGEGEMGECPCLS